ncbi:MAG: hypothetical protein RJA00_1627 [Bacteroidota bacterium]
MGGFVSAHDIHECPIRKKYPRKKLNPTEIEYHCNSLILCDASGT